MDKEEILREAAEEHLLHEASRRRFLYADVEALISTGFLHHTLLIGDSSVTLRSLLPEDIERLKARSATSRRRGDSLAVLRWSLASSVWMVDGFEIPVGSPNGAFFLYHNWAQDLHKVVVEALHATVSGLRNRMDRAVQIVEAFCYEPYSRSLWRMMGRPTRDLSSQNIIKRLWAAYNMAEDTVVAEDREWGRTRAIVSSMSNKGGAQISKNLQKLQDREENRKHRVIEDTVNWILYGEEGRRTLTVTVNGKEVEVPRVHAAQTVQDLEEEMRRVFTGEKDFHDTLVAQYHEGIRKQTEERRKARYEAILAARRRSEDAGEIEAPPMVGYTKEQLSQLNPRVLKHRTTSTVPESAQTNYLYERYFQPALKPGVLTPSLKVEEAEREKGGRKEKSLQERIESRTPKIEGG